MRKRFFLWLAIFCCLAFTVGILAACNSGDSTQMGGQTPADSSAYAGRYYEEVNGRLDADSWIELGDDWTWVDSDTMMGTFTVDGSSIHFYWATASEPMFDGTISDGEFTVNILGALYKYKQGTPSADTPEEPDEGDPDDEKPEEPEGEYHTVTFDVNGGEEAVLPHEYLVGALMSLPTPTREGYRFWGWFDELGVRYDNSSVMPDEDLTLTAEWKIIVTSYEDEYIYFKPATEGKKNSDSYYDRYASSGIHHYMYLELESDSIGGPEAVGSSNNLDLASRVDMDFSVADGYTLTWYNDSGFTSINGAQRFTLGYGSNIYFLTVSEGSRVVQRYLIDFYIKYDYYISLYSNIYENESYNEENRVRVIEGEKIAFSDLEQKAERDFEFDNWVYFNYDLGKYVEFDFDVAIYKNWSLYQTFKPQTITANLGGGSLDEELLITPYTPYQQLPVPTKENYDFIGWQLADGDYFADITGYGSTTLLSDDNYFKSLKAEFRPKKYYKDVSDEGDTISFVSTIPVVFYTDESRAKIHEIYYLPTELLPCSPVPDAVPLTGDDIFLGWRSYYGTEEAEIFDFNQAIEGPTSVFPEFRAATYDSEVGIGNGYTFTSDNSFDTHHVTVWLPSSGEYILTVSGKAGISVAAYGEYEASSYTSTSSRPATIVLLCDDLSGRPAAVTLKQTSGKVTLSLSGETGYSDQSQKIDPTTAKYGEFGKEVLLNARENVGGIFLGWYDEDDVQVSGKGSYLYMFTMPGNEVTYTAKWAKASVVSEDAAKGTVSQLTKKYLPGEEVSVTATTNLGYTFIGWYNGDEKVADTLTYKFEMPAEDVTYTAKWIACPVNLEVSNADAGSVGMPTTTVAGERVAITATTNPGYTFIGWYNGNEQVAATPTYEFIMPTENVTYTAKWIKVTVESEDTTKGTVSRLTGTYLPGEEVSVTATTNLGYTFIGWYNGDEKLTDSLTYEFTMPEENVTYTAKWIKVTVESEDTAKGTVSRLTGTYLSGEEVSITATTKSGYTFIGWYNGEEKVADSLTYEFTMPGESVTYTAKWITNAEMEPFVFTSTPTSLTIQGVTDSNVTSLEVPSYVTEISRGAFRDCSSLASITIPFVGATEDGTEDTHFGYIFGASSYSYNDDYIPTSLKEVIITGGTSIGQNAFRYCSGLTSVTIPDSVTSIGQFAFEACAAEIVWGDAPEITEIGNYAFYGYEGTSITIPDSVTSIGGYAFHYCSGLTSVTIPDSVTSIGEYAFYDCTSLESIIIPFVGATKDGTSNTHFGYIFGASTYSYNDDYVPTSLKEVIITGGTSIDDYAFDGCSGLTSVIIPDSVTSIGEFAFASCKGLTEITIPDSVTNIANNAFAASGLKSIRLPNGLESISSQLFYNCSSLTSITIPDGVTSIESYAFYECTGLTSITIPDSVTSIGYEAFYGCYSLVSVYYTGDITSWLEKSWHSDVMAGGRALYLEGNKVEGEIGIPDGTTSIPSYAFAYQTGITSIIIPDSVTSIGQSAFYGCSALTSVTIGNGVTSIGDYAFYGCTSLTSITIPNSVFRGCSSLASITIPFVGASKDGTSNTHFGYIFGASSYNSNGNYVPTSLKEVIITGGTSIGQNAFRYCSGLTSVTIPDSVTSIGDGAFYQCNSLTSVTIGNGVTSIGEDAFYGCSGLTSVIIPDSVTSIGDDAFYGCDSLTSINYNGDMTSWLGKTWHGKVMLSGGVLYIDGNKVEGELVIPDGTTSIPSYAFAYQTGITSVTIPGSVTSIGRGAFGGCGSLRSITIPFVGAEAGKTSSDAYQYPFGYIFGALSYTGREAVTQYYYGSSTSSTTRETYYIPSSLRSVTVTGGNILFGAFYDCSMLTSVTIPDSVTSIGREAFYGCSGLTSITIPDSVTSIGSFAFSGCSGLTSITIPDSVTSIGSSAFRGCSRLTSITIPASVTSIGDSAFRDCNSLTSVTIPDGVTSIEGYAFWGCSGLTSVTIPDGVTSIEGYAFWGCSGLTSVTIPDSVTSIGGYAFYGCTSLTSITIPNSVTSIGDSAFRDCNSLTSVTIPDSVTSIGERAFEDCAGLTSVAIGNGVTSIGNRAFLDCTGIVSAEMPTLAIAYIPKDSLQTIVLTSGESIEANAFSGCTSLTSVTIPDSVTSIGENAFSDCTGIVSAIMPTLAIAYIPKDSLQTVVLTSGESIAANAFSGCTSLTSVTIPDSVTSIGENAFSGCTGIVSATMPTLAIAYIPKDSLQTVVLTSGESIEANAFSGYTSLTSLTIPDSVTSIGHDAFSLCIALQYNEHNNVLYLGNAENRYVALIKTKDSSITSVNIPDSTKLIYEYAFSGCSGLTSVTIPNGVVSIGDHAFENCTSLTSLTIPDSVTSIGSGAFSGCDNLQYNEYDNVLYLGNAENRYVALIKAKDTSISSVNIPDSTKLIYEGAFSGCTGLTFITIPSSVTSIGDEAFSDCSELESITVEEGNSVYHSAGNCLIETASKTLIAGCKTSIIPDDGSVTSIGRGAFYGCSGLTSVIIPDSVTSIGDGAFYNCNGLTSITIPDSVTSIGQGAFLLCNGLSSVTFKVTDGWRAYNNTSTSGVSLSSSNLSNKSTAANHLKLLYAYYYWEREVNE